MDSTRPDDPDALLALRYGGATVAENIAKAVASGALIEEADGTLRTRPRRARRSSWMVVENAPQLDCEFLTHVGFEAIYAETAVPYGCRACYKVKLRFETLRQLMAGWELGRKTRCLSKWGLDLANRYSQDVYAGYFYVAGLEEARVLHRVVREAVDADPRLGSEVRITIKRGCSQFEAAVGPSDTYSFTPQQEALEAWLRARFVPHPPGESSRFTVLRWIETAFQMGDDTYLEFTGGKRLRRASVSYEP